MLSPQGQVQDLLVGSKSKSLAGITLTDLFFYSQIVFHICFLVSEFRITAAEFSVGDVRINVVFMQVLVVGFIGVSQYQRDDNVIVIDVFTNP